MYWCSLQAAEQQNSQLQKECEELKEELVVTQTAGIVLKLKVQQLEKEVEANKHQVLELENQVEL
jgi:septal ring factor EnvC (AmiA/AmiB activator)